MAQDPKSQQHPKESEAAETASGKSGAKKALERARRASEEAEEIITGGNEPELEGREALDNIVRTIARRVGASHTRLTGGHTLETMARLRQDSLLSTQLVPGTGASVGVAKGTGAQTLMDALTAVETSAISELFATEKGRLDEYQTYQQITDLITQASEAVQIYCDNIVSPDDFTKRDINIFYEGQDSDGTLLTEVRSKLSELSQKYNIEDKGEEAIIKSLTKGDFFIAVLNLRQELGSLLSEGQETAKPSLIEAADIPMVEDSDVEALRQLVEDSGKDSEEGQASSVDPSGTFRQDLANYLNSFVTVNENTSFFAAKELEAKTLERDIPGKRSAAAAGSRKRKEKEKLESSKIFGSVVKMIEPDDVIKLYQDDVLFGYYVVELSGPEAIDNSRRGTVDQAPLIVAVDKILSARFASNMSILQGKDAIISRVIVKTLANKMGDAKFLTAHEEFAHDAYAILSRARRENRRATFTFVASDQMVHFTPNGATGYGESVLSRVRFLSKLYIGAQTNAFMRNSIRRPERLVWYIDVGADNDGSNAVQSFIRTIKQREVKFSTLRDITTTINQIGEFHDFYVPTYNGERPVEVETLNMGGAAEVDGAYLDYLRKAIIGGMGVPAAFVGYSEEIAFARSLTMDNGRLLRRVVRHQKHYGRSMTRLVQILWKNEYMDLKVLTGEDESKQAEEEKEANETDQIDVSKLVVRYPSPATLNMTNLSDAISQANPVIDFIVDALTPSEDDPVKAELKKRVTRDMLPQIHWERYEELLKDARNTEARKKVSGTEGGTEE